MREVRKSTRVRFAPKSTLPWSSRGAGSNTMTSHTNHARMIKPRRSARHGNPVFLEIGASTRTGSDLVHLPSQERRDVVLVIFLLPGAQLQRTLTERHRFHFLAAGFLSLPRRRVKIVDNRT